MIFFKTYQKFIATVAVVCFSFSMLTPPPQASAQVPGENISLPLLAMGIPRELASIKEAFLPDPKIEKTPLIHIQSVHAHAETQKKIYALLKFLDEKYGINALFIEGAGEELNPDYFRFFQENRLNVKVAQNLVEKGELTGAELFLVESQKKIPAYGIEDPDLYRSNLESFQTVMSRRDETNVFTQGLRGNLGNLETHLLAPSALRILRTSESFDAGQMELLSYAFELERKTKEILGVDLRSFDAQADWPEMLRLLRLQEAESGIDVEKIESDRQKLISDLKEMKVESELVEAFQTLSFSPYQSGMVYDPGFRKNDLPRYLAEHLVVETMEKGFSFDHYPYFTHYLEAAVLQSELDAERLFNEMERLFQTLVHKITPNEEEWKLVGLVQKERLFERLFNLELTPKDYAKAEEIHRTDRPLIHFLLDAESLYDKTNLEREKMIPENIQAIEYLYGQAMQFYDLAKKREDAMIERILEKGTAYSVPRSAEESRSTQDAVRRTGVTVLITGGFHADGLSHAFKKRGISYTLLSPRITEKASPEDYISSLLGEKKTAFDTQYLEPVIKEISNAIRTRMTSTKFLGDETIRGRNRIIKQEIAAVLEAIVEMARTERIAAPKIIRAINASRYANDRQFVLILSREEDKALVWDNEENKPLLNNNEKPTPIVIPVGTVTVETQILDARSQPTTKDQILSEFNLPGKTNENAFGDAAGQASRETQRIRSPLQKMRALRPPSIDPVDSFVFSPLRLKPKYSYVENYKQYTSGGEGGQVEPFRIEHIAGNESGRIHRSEARQDLGGVLPAFLGKAKHSPQGNPDDYKSQENISYLSNILRAEVRNESKTPLWIVMGAGAAFGIFSAGAMAWRNGLLSPQNKTPQVETAQDPALLRLDLRGVQAGLTDLYRQEDRLYRQASGLRSKLRDLEDSRILLEIFLKDLKTEHRAGRGTRLVWQEIQTQQKKLQEKEREIARVKDELAENTNQTKTIRKTIESAEAKIGQREKGASAAHQDLENAKDRLPDLRSEEVRLKQAAEAKENEIKETRARIRVLLVNQEHRAGDLGFQPRNSSRHPLDRIKILRDEIAGIESEINQKRQTLPQLEEGLRQLQIDLLNNQREIRRIGSGMTSSRSEVRMGTEEEIKQAMEEFKKRLEGKGTFRWPAGVYFGNVEAKFEVRSSPESPFALQLYVVPTEAWKKTEEGNLKFPELARVESKRNYVGISGNRFPGAFGKILVSFDVRHFSGKNSLPWININEIQSSPQLEKVEGEIRKNHRQSGQKLRRWPASAVDRVREIGEEMNGMVVATSPERIDWMYPGEIDEANSRRHYIKPFEQRDGKKLLWTKQVLQPAFYGTFFEGTEYREENVLWVSQKSVALVNELIKDNPPIWIPYERTRQFGRAETRVDTSAFWPMRKLLTRRGQSVELEPWQFSGQPMALVFLVPKADFRKSPDKLKFELRWNWGDPYVTVKNPEGKEKRVYSEKNVGEYFQVVTFPEKLVIKRLIGQGPESGPMMILTPGKIRRSDLLSVVGGVYQMALRSWKRLIETDKKNIEAIKENAGEILEAAEDIRRRVRSRNLEQIPDRDQIESLQGAMMDLAAVARKILKDLENESGRSEVRAGGDRVKEFLDQLRKMSKNLELIKQVKSGYSASGSLAYEISSVLGRFKAALKSEPPFAERPIHYPNELQYGDILISSQPIQSTGQITTTVQEVRTGKKEAKASPKIFPFLVLGPNPQDLSQTLLVSSEKDSIIVPVPNDWLVSPMVYKILAMDERMPSDILSKEPSPLSPDREFTSALQSLHAEKDKEVLDLLQRSLAFLDKKRFDEGPPVSVTPSLIEGLITKKSAALSPKQTERLRIFKEVMTSGQLKAKAPNALNLSLRLILADIKDREIFLRIIRDVARIHPDTNEIQNHLLVSLLREAALGGEKPLLKLENGALLPNRSEVRSETPESEKKKSQVPKWALEAVGVPAEEFRNHLAAKTPEDLVERLKFYLSKHEDRIFDAREWVDAKYPPVAKPEVTVVPSLTDVPKMALTDPSQALARLLFEALLDSKFADKLTRLGERRGFLKMTSMLAARAALGPLTGPAAEFAMKKLVQSGWSPWYQFIPHFAENPDQLRRLQNNLQRLQKLRMLHAPEVILQNELNLIYGTTHYPDTDVTLPPLSPGQVRDRLDQVLDSLQSIELGDKVQVASELLDLLIKNPETYSLIASFRPTGLSGQADELSADELARLIEKAFDRIPKIAEMRLRETLHWYPYHLRLHAQEETLTDLVTEGFQKQMKDQIAARMKKLNEALGKLRPDIRLRLESFQETKEFQEAWRKYSEKVLEPEKGDEARRVEKSPEKEQTKTPEIEGGFAPLDRYDLTARQVWMDDGGRVLPDEDTSRAEVRTEKLTSEEQKAVGDLQFEINSLFDNYQNTMDSAGMQTPGTPTLVIRNNGKLEVVHREKEKDLLMATFERPETGIFERLMKDLKIESIEFVFNERGLAASLSWEYGTVRQTLPNTGFIRDLLEDFLSDLKKGRSPLRDRDRDYFKRSYLHDLASPHSSIHPLSGRSYNLDLLGVRPGDRGTSSYVFRLGLDSGMIKQPPRHFKDLMSQVERLAASDEFPGVTVNRGAETIRLSRRLTGDLLAEVGPSEYEQIVQIEQPEHGTLILKSSEPQATEITFTARSIKIKTPKRSVTIPLEGAYPIQSIGLRKGSDRDYATDPFFYLRPEAYNKLVPVLRENGVSLGGAVLVHSVSRLENESGRAEVRSEEFQDEKQVKEALIKAAQTHKEDARQIAQALKGTTPAAALKELEEKVSGLTDSHAQKVAKEILSSMNPNAPLNNPARARLASLILFLRESFDLSIPGITPERKEKPKPLTPLPVPVRILSSSHVSAQDAERVVQELSAILASLEPERKIVLWLEHGSPSLMPDRFTGPKELEELLTEPMNQSFVQFLRNKFAETQRKETGVLEKMHLKEMKKSGPIFDMKLGEALLSLSAYYGKNVEFRTERAPFDSYLDYIRYEPYSEWASQLLLEGQNEQALSKAGKSLDLMAQSARKRDQKLASMIQQRISKYPKDLHIVIRGAAHGATLSHFLSQETVKAENILLKRETPTLLAMGRYLHAGSPSLSTPEGRRYVLEFLIGLALRGFPQKRDLRNRIKPEFIKVVEMLPVEFLESWFREAATGKAKNFEEMGENNWNWFGARKDQMPEAARQIYIKIDEEIRHARADRDLNDRGTPLGPDGLRSEVRRNVARTTTNVPQKEKVSVGRGPSDVGPLRAEVREEKDVERDGKKKINERAVVPVSGRASLNKGEFQRLDPLNPSQYKLPQANPFGDLVSSAIHPDRQDRKNDVDTKPTNEQRQPKNLPADVTQNPSDQNGISGIHKRPADRSALPRAKPHFHPFRTPNQASRKLIPDNNKSQEKNVEISTHRLTPIVTPVLTPAGPADAMMPQGVILEMKGVVERRPYFKEGMKPEELIRAIVEVARQMHWVFNPDDAENPEVLKVLLAVASEAVNAQTGDSKAYREIARLFVLLAKGANQPGTHATVLNYVPTPADLRALVLPVIENKNARVEIFITPEAITNEEGRAELAKRIQEVEKLVPGGRAEVRYQTDWVSLYQSVLDSAQKTYKDLYPEGEIKFETFLERYFVLSLPEELSEKAGEFDAKVGKGLRSVIYSIPKEGIGKRAAYLVLEAGVATKLAQEVLSRLQEKEYFDKQGSHYFLRSDLFAMVEAIWKVFEASKWISAAA